MNDTCEAAARRNQQTPPHIRSLRNELCVKCRCVLFHSRLFHEASIHTCAACKRKDSLSTTARFALVYCFHIFALGEFYGSLGRFWVGLGDLEWVWLASGGVGETRGLGEAGVILGELG